MSDCLRGLAMALHREQIGDLVRWTSTLNGERCEFLTSDASLVLTERGIANGELVGVELVDQHDVRRAVSVRTV